MVEKMSKWGTFLRAARQRASGAPSVRVELPAARPPETKPLAGVNPGTLLGARPGAALAQIDGIGAGSCRKASRLSPRGRGESNQTRADGEHHGHGMGMIGPW